jgi:phosphatidylserine/phosphatidylglycerophosphate/cardiolipin synthase-like enzyme
MSLGTSLAVLCSVKLIVQPKDGLGPVLASIRQDRKEIDVVIFRCDRKELQEALEAAVKRGVRVRALIAHINSGGGKKLRKLELDLLAAGAIVARTGDEFVRYHGKMLVVDRAALWVLGFNFVALDINKSRSFGVMTRRRDEVAEALRLFEADVTRKAYVPGACAQFVVSPETARAELSKFVQKAKTELLIYDPKVSDREIIELLKARVKSGVSVKIIGRVAGGARDLPNEKFPGHRLHVRVIVRDRSDAFIGSQSLRALELDKRREIGLIVHDKAIVAEMIKVFEEDWAETPSGKKEKKDKEGAREKDKDKDKDKGEHPQPAA